ncbi:putative NAD(P)-binding domain-containing protein [Lupinus albus]|uniref:Putative NAD(P)-binding domain-containing protein n=1 Tax=Lupinus albus TaxID=3870 RepID=A0A6A4QJ83_LUPAL|nr:putative NAD(P)-binding domain-containing protein [Lupinus albus]
MTSFLSFSAVSARPIPSAFSLKPHSFQFQTPTPTLHFKPNRFYRGKLKNCHEIQLFAIRSNYADAGVRDDSSSNTIDVVADVRSERIVVLGGSGFVGSAICKAAISKGIEVISISRSGRTTYPGEWVDQVTWLSGDVFYVNWDEVLVGATAVVSTLGGFGSEDHMRRINGEANIVAVNAAKKYGEPSQ